ncbi:MAG: hypothetical protein R8G66_30210 [Cytophagales bacterium]|nr:hypothetical protein [Cytophagales bacterium]
MKRIGKLIRGGSFQMNLHTYYAGMTNEQLINQKKSFRNSYIGLFSGWFAFFGFLLWQSSFDGVHVALFASILPATIAIEEDYKKRRKAINEILNQQLAMLEES